MTASFGSEHATLENALEPGKRFGRYEVLRRIGAGGMGEVFLAYDESLTRNVAIKILNENFSRDQANLDRFVREARAASALSHPNIIVIHEIDHTDGAHFIVSEFIEGRTLREVISAEPLSLPAVLDIAIQIANALSVAHDAGLIHRDIKPENVILRDDGYVKILDFGLAKHVGRDDDDAAATTMPGGRLDTIAINPEEVTLQLGHTAKGMILGTLNYMSPEQARGARVDERTDIFSFGALLYEMMAEQPPFAGDSASDTILKLINTEPEPLSCFAAVPADLQNIVSKALTKDLDGR